MSNTYLDLLASFGIGGAHPGGITISKSILENENIQSNESVLDIGCGTGQTAAFLANRFGCEVTAVDNHPIMIDKAKQRLNKYESLVKVLKEDIQNMSLEDSSYDLIIAESVITFTDISRTLREVNRLLKSDGRLLLIEMTAEQQLTEELMEKMFRLYGINQILTEEEWFQYFQQAGFTHIEVIHTGKDIYQTEIDDMNPSENINMSLYDLWDEHNDFLSINKHLIGFRIFKCQII